MKKRVISSLCVVSLMFVILGVSQQANNCINTIDKRAMKPYLGKSTAYNNQTDEKKSDSNSIIWAEETDLTFLPYNTDSNIKAVPIP